LTRQAKPTERVFAMLHAYPLPRVAHDEAPPLPGITPAWVRAQLIGQDAVVQTPFGERRIVYADHVASGRSLQWIESFIAAQVLPLYANTHTEDSATGARMTAWVHDARQFIKACLGAEDCKLLFCGTGCTAAIKRLQEILGLAWPERFRDAAIDWLGPAQRPIVFVGPYEHHSNEVSWRETIAEVVELPLDARGGLDLGALRGALRDARTTGRPLIGSFSAASNVTGALTDTRAVARLLHEHGALAFFDFAAAAPHIDIDMRCGRPDGYDAVFFSAHKLVGGPGTPGILVFDPALYRLRAPTTAGGGTVAHVSSNEHHFVGDIEQREDAGTPGTVQCIRAALAFMVKQSVGAAAIEQLERTMIRSAITRLRCHPRIELLGDLEAPRLAILSFLVRTRAGRYLHPRLVVRLLNDLFGIQSRGGCACAGPYAHRLLDISSARADAIRDAVLARFESVKPGWTRMSFSWHIEPAEFEFLQAAIEFIADHGERFVRQYRCDWHTGAWHHALDQAQPGLCATAAPPLPAQPMSPLTSGDHGHCLLRAHALAADSPVGTAHEAGCRPSGLPAALVLFDH
jgi:selenocysteine lyase/cysteine desulfurase